MWKVLLAFTGSADAKPENLKHLEELETQFGTRKSALQPPEEISLSDSPWSNVTEPVLGGAAIGKVQRPIFSFDGKADSMEFIECIGEHYEMCELLENIMPRIELLSG